jgi:hypothetical protein
MLFVAPVYALNEVRLLNLSSSNQTALFNLGSFDGVKEKDFAVIVKEIRSLDSIDLRVVPVARARNVKINTDASVWILYKIYDPELLVRGDKFLILSETELLSGRRDPRFSRLTTVGRTKQTPSEIAKNGLSNDHDEMVKLKSKYKEGRKLHDEKVITNDDGTLIDLERWENMKGERYRVALYKSPNQEDFRREMRLATFEKLVTNYLRKINDPDFNYDQFYEEQMRTEYSNEFRKQSNSNTEYKDYLARKNAQFKNDLKIRRYQLEQGDVWSEDFSDEELKDNLKSISALQEKDRREYLVTNPPKYSLFLDYGFSINDSQTDKDPYQRDGRAAIEAGLEFIPFLKHQTLERFTLFSSLRRNQTAFETNGSNAGVDEFSLTAGANWYPLYAPYTVEAPVFFIGTFIRSGYATVAAPTPGDKANYTVLSVPGLWGGMKYNLRSGVGLRVIASMETLSLDRYESSKTESILPDSTQLVEARAGFGLNYMF